MIDGLLLVDKPAGISSFGVVARVRGALSRRAGKKIKVGHTGTLDPFATGLMILVIGSYCRRAGEFSKLDKVYEATIHLGVRSSTGDPEGELMRVSDAVPSVEAVRAACGQFVGTVVQRPPVFSAIKIGGRRAYDLARQGIKVEMPERTVMVHSLEILDYTYPQLRIRVHVSSGTYIRTLASDIGDVLGVGAYCEQLRRTSIAAYSVANAKSLGELLGAPNDALVRTDLQNPI